MRFGLGWFAALALVGCSSGTVSTGSTSAGSTNSGATGGSSTGGTGGTVACPACTQDADCGEEGSAICAFNQPGDVVGGCISACTTQGDCPADTACVANGSGFMGCSRAR